MSEPPKTERTSAERLADMRERVQAWAGVEFDCGDLEGWLRAVVTAHGWPGCERDEDSVADALSEIGDAEESTLVLTLTDALRLAHRDRVHAIAEIDALKSDRDEAVLALEKLREVARSMEECLRRLDCHLDGAHFVHDPDHPERDVLCDLDDTLSALAEALSATPTTLAEQMRRELMAEGIDEVASLLLRVGETRSARASSAMADELRSGRIKAEFAAKHEAATKLRGER